MKRALPIVLLILANIAWGSSWAIAKIALTEMPAPILAGLRMSIAACCFWPLWWYSRWQGGALAPRVSWQQIPPADLLKMAGLGLLAMGFGYLLGYQGVQMTNASDAVLMIIGEVTFTALLAARFAGEPLDRWKLAGIGLGSLGVLALVLGNLNNDPVSGWSRAVGNLLILSGLFMQASYSVFGSRFARRYDPLTLVTMIYTGSLVIWVPWLLGTLLSGSWPAISTTGWLAVWYLALLPSVGCNLLWFIIIRRIGPSVGAITLFIQPVVGTILGIWLLGDPLTLGLVIGGSLIMLALALMSQQALRGATRS